VTAVGAAVLVVDDDRHVRRLLVATFADAPYRVAEAATGAEALEVARRERPAVVLLDAVMPGLDGYAVCRAIKEDPALRDTAVVLLTGQRSDDARGRAAEAGADGYLLKPFSLQELRVLVDRLVAPPG
jgi:two-component system phosphate regulon response regulator PhoB